MSNSTTKTLQTQRRPIVAIPPSPTTVQERITLAESFRHYGQKD